MKKLNVKYVILFFVSVLVLTSCMGERGNKQTGSAVGVVRFDTKTFKNVLDVTETDAFFWIGFDQVSTGVCLFVDYEIDYDAPENSYESVLANGYLTVIITKKEVVDNFDMAYSVSDTSIIMKDEVTIYEPVLGKEFYYVKGMAFFYSVVDVPNKQDLYWSLSCNIQDIVKTENGVRYYDVYLRCYKIFPIRTESSEKRYCLNAYDMKSYFEKIAREENNLGSDTFKLRINYPSTINDDQITWSQVTIENIPVVTFE